MGLKTAKSNALQVSHTPGPWEILMDGDEQLCLLSSAKFIHIVDPVSGVGPCMIPINGLLGACQLMADALTEHGKMISSKQVKALKLMLHAISKAKEGA